MTQQAQRTILLTGGTSGIGLAMAWQLASPDVKLVIAGRSRESGEKAASALSAQGPSEFRQLDLANLASVRTFADGLLRDTPRMDVLINNAGITSQTLQHSVDGVELVFATNVLGPFLLTRLLRPLLEASSPSRIVVTASSFAGDLDLNDLTFARRRYEETAAYRQSKQANRMLTWALARRLDGKGVTANAFAPGLVLDTNIYARASASTLRILKVVNFFSGRTREQGADTGTWLSTSPEVEGLSGRYFEARKERRCKFRNSEDEERLWAACEALCERTSAVVKTDLQGHAR